VFIISIGRKNIRLFDLKSYGLLGGVYYGYVFDNVVTCVFLVECFVVFNLLTRAASNLILSDLDFEMLLNLLM
jgi:uncharacterized membrane protein